MKRLYRLDETINYLESRVNSDYSKKRFKNNETLGLIGGLILALLTGTFAVTADLLQRHRQSGAVPPVHQIGDGKKFVHEWVGNEPRI